MLVSISPARLRLLVASLLSVSFLGALDHTIVSTSLSTIAGQLGAPQHLSWVIVSYTLASTVLMPVLGRLADTVGARTVFLVSLALFLLSSLACGFAPSMGWLVVGRVVQGMSSAGLQLMSQTIVANAATPRQRPRLLAIVGAAFPVAILVGPLLGGLITDYWGWRWVFWINLPIGVAAFALAVFAIPRVPARAGSGFNPLGATLFTCALVALVLAATWAGDPQLLIHSLIAGAGGVALLALFFLVERGDPHQTVPIRFLRNRTIAMSVVLSAMIGIGMFSITAYLPSYIQMAYGTTATVSGLVPIATVFGMLVSNLASGWLVSRTGRYRLFPVAGTALAAAGLAAMALLPVGLPLWAPMALMAVVGIGTGAFMNLVVALVQGEVPRGETGSATALVNVVRQIGSTVVTAVIGGVVGASLIASLPGGLDPNSVTPQAVQAAPPEVRAAVAELYHGIFTPIFAGLACAFLVAFVAALLLPPGRLSDEPDPVDPAPAPAPGSAPA